MRRQQKAATRTTEPFLPDEAQLRHASDVADLCDRLAQVEQQVLAQYTAAAAYATIAQQHGDEVRAEARADVDRVQSTVIGLLEHLRAEVLTRLDALEARPAIADPLNGAGNSRLGLVEAQMAAVMVALERAQRENQELRMHIERLVERQMREEGWLASSGPVDALSLR
jgi:hypothetical protein